MSDQTDAEITAEVGRFEYVEEFESAVLYACPICGAIVSQYEREKHIRWHRRTDA